MTYAGSFLKAHGTRAVILRKPPILTRVSMERSTNATTYLGAREGYYTGLTLAENKLKSGEVFAIGKEKYLVQSAAKSFGDGETEFMAAKVNAVLELKRCVETADYYGDITESWDSIKAYIYSFGEIVTKEVRRLDPGILEGTIRIFQVPKSIAFKLRDRIVFNGKNYDVISIDDILEGIARLQVMVDTRGDGTTDIDDGEDETDETD